MPFESDSSLPLAVWQTIERLCTEYERRLKSGETIDVAELLAEVPSEARAVLERELAAIVADYESDKPLPSAAVKSTQTHLGPTAGGIETATVLGPLNVDLPPLDQHPRYRLVRCLSQGERCVTWHAEDRLMRRPVVLRCIHVDRLQDAEATTGFSQLIQRLQAWRDPHIAAVHETEAFGGSMLVISEYVDGNSLGELLLADEKLPLAMACAVVHAALLGVQFAANHGVVHGQLSPQSIVRTRENATKIVDYPLSIFETKPDPLYAAPERLAGGSGEIRSDIYSLGCILSALLAGAGELPSQLTAVVEKMTAARPLDRYATAAEAAKALRPWTTVVRATRPRRARWAAIVSLCLAIMLVWIWQIVDSQQLRTISTNDPHVEVAVRGGLVVSVRDPLEDRDYSVTEQRLILAEAVSDKGLRIPLADGGLLLLRKDGDEWIVIRAVKTESMPEAPVTNGVADTMQPPSEETPSRQVPATEMHDSAISKHPAREPMPPAIKGPDSAKSTPPSRDPLPFQQALDFRVEIDLDQKELRQWVEDLPADFTPVDINARALCEPPRFNVLALRLQKPVNYRIAWSVANEGVQRTLDKNDEKTWALSVVAPYVHEGRRYVHHIWERDREVWGVWGWWGRHWQDVPNLLQGFRKESLRPVQISLNPPPADGGVSGFTLRPDEGLDWECDFDLTGDQLERKIESALRRDWRPDALACYPGNGHTPLYSVVTVSNPSRARWEFQRELTHPDLQAAINECRERSLRPKNITSATAPDGDPRYTALWVEYQPLSDVQSDFVAQPAIPDKPHRAAVRLTSEIRRFTGFPERTWVTHCAFSPDGQHVLAVSGMVREWETETGKEVAAYAKTAPFSWGFDVSPDARFAVIAGDDAQVYLYSRKAGRHLAHWPTGQEGPYGFGAIFSPNGEQLLTWPHRGKGARLWDWKSRTLTREFPSQSGHWNCRMTTDGKKVLTAGVENVVRVLDVETGELLQALKGHTETVADVVCSPDGRTAVTGAADKTLIVWNLDTGSRIRVLSGHTAGLNRLAMANDGRRVLSCAEDRTARLWDIEAGQELATLEANTDSGASSRVSDVQFSPDGKYGLTCAFDGTVRLWRLPELPVSESETPP